MSMDEVTVKLAECRKKQKYGFKLLKNKQNGIKYNGYRCTVSSNSINRKEAAKECKWMKATTEPTEELQKQGQWTKLQ
jgi:hypothetical protein